MDNILTFYAGQTKTIVVPVTSFTWNDDYTIETEAAFNLTGYNEIFLTVKKRKDSQIEILEVEGTIKGDAALGLLEFEILASDTVDIEPGQYVYDIWIGDGTDFFPVVDSILKVLEPVNKTISLP